MSKNLTRKGLALGALVALGSSVIAGAPAFAANELSIAPSAGTSLNTFVTDTFELKATFAPGVVPAAWTQLRYQIKTDGVATIKATSSEATGTAAAGTLTLNSDNIANVAANAPTATTQNFLSLKVNGAAYDTASSAVVVTAYVDSNNNGTFESASDTWNSTTTVNFLKYSEVTAAPVLTAPLEGDSRVTASVRFSNVNNEQLSNSNVTVTFTKGDDSAISGSATATAAAWSTTDGFVAGTSTTANLVKAEAVKAQAKFRTYAVGTATTAAITARAIQTLSADSVVSTTQNSSEEVALNKAFSVYAKAVDFTTPTALAIAGKTVSYSVTAANLPATAAGVTSSTDTLTINGVTYTNQAALPGATGVAKLSGVTNADGKVIVTGSSTGAADGDTFVFSFTAENHTTGLTLTEKTITPSKAYITNYQGDAAAVASGASVSLNIAAYDQFGGAMVDGYDARAVWASSTRTTTATTNTTAAVVAAVVGGKATLTLPDAGAGTGTNVWNVSLVKRDTTTGAYTGKTSAVDTSLDFTSADTVTAFTVNFKAAADLVAGEIALTDGTTALALNTDKTKYVYTAAVNGGASSLAALSTADFGSYDARGVVGTIPAPGVSAVVVAGTVKSASTSTYAGVAVPGTTVTVAGAGLQFKSVEGGADVWATGSITVNTSATGTFSVDVYSQKTGAQTVTVTSGAAKSVVDLNFAAADDNAGTSVVITAPASTIPGRTIDVSALVSDKFGNAVNTTATNTAADAGADLSVAYAGPGLVLNTIAQETDASGLVKFSVLLGATEAGSATVTVKYDANGDADYADTGDIVKTATITIAAAAAVEPTSKIGTANSRVYVNVKDGKGSVVTVKIGAKWFTRSALNNDYTLSFKAAKGKKVSVKVYVDGDLSSSKTITVK